jgi:hypothetical protein
MGCAGNVRTGPSIEKAKPEGAEPGEGDIRVLLSGSKTRIHANGKAEFTAKFVNGTPSEIRFEKGHLFFFGMNVAYVDPCFDHGYRYTDFPERGSTEMVVIPPQATVSLTLEFTAPDTQGPWDICLRYPHILHTDARGAKTVKFFDSNQVKIDIIQDQ